MNLVDGIFFIVLAWGAYRGFSRGLISMICRFGGFLVGVWLAGLYYIPVAKFLGTRLGLKELLTKIFIPFCAGGVPAGSFPQFTPDAGSSLPGFPPSLWEPVHAIQGGISGMTSARLMADSLVKLVAFFLVFAVVSICLGAFLELLAKIATGFAHIVLLGGVNRVGGSAVGLINNALFLVVAVGMITPLLYSMSLGFWGDGFRTALINNWETSVLVPYFNKSWEVASQVLANFFQMV
ncbi:MAG TPA: CvpA family protein [Syntrophomonadaceae bacterium]|nr:CvpA family protein [Syntrophomonadaceae bacterium]